jgi:hypothetical protein
LKRKRTMFKMKKMHPIVYRPVKSHGTWIVVNFLARKQSVFCITTYGGRSHSQCLR